MGLSYSKSSTSTGEKPSGSGLNIMGTVSECVYGREEVGDRGACDGEERCREQCHDRSGAERPATQQSLMTIHNSFACEPGRAAVVGASRIPACWCYG